MLDLNVFFMFIYINFLHWYVTAVLFIKSKFQWVGDLKNQIMCIRSDPEYTKWVSISCILDNQVDFNMFLHDCNHRDLLRRIIYSNYNDSYEFHETVVPRIQFDKTIAFLEYWRTIGNDVANRSIHYPIVLVKQDTEHCIVKLLGNNKASGANENLLQIDNILFFKSKISFLNILYYHPNMKEEIHLKIPIYMYFVGNHLLSATFVYRLLEYTVGYMFYFDMNYKLKIMDNRMNYFELGHNQYVVIEYNDYKVVTL
jgi:hypothetical protein